MASAASSDFILVSSSGVSIAPKLKDGADVLLKADAILLQVAVRLAFRGKQNAPTRGHECSVVRSLQAISVGQADFLHSLIVSSSEGIKPCTVTGLRL
jgi:hypothetical protein